MARLPDLPRHLEQRIVYLRKAEDAALVIQRAYRDTQAKRLGLVRAAVAGLMQLARRRIVTIVADVFVYPPGTDGPPSTRAFVMDEPFETDDEAFFDQVLADVLAETTRDAETEAAAAGDDSEEHDMSRSPTLIATLLCERHSGTICVYNRWQGFWRLGHSQSFSRRWRGDRVTVRPRGLKRARETAPLPWE